MPTAVVAGALANKPGYGGAAWVRLSYALGLERLGWTIAFVEEIASADLLGGDGHPCDLGGFERSRNLAFFKEVVTAFGLGERAALICDGGKRAWGMTLPECVDAAASADVLVNVGGNLRLDSIRALPRRSIYVDLDPGYTQTWLAAGHRGLGVGGHDAHFTVGANVGSPDCPIPAAGIDWLATLPPVVLDLWPARTGPGFGRFTTVAAWRGPYGPVAIGGEVLGPKAHELRRFAAVPGRAPGRFEVALDIDGADRADRDGLERNGWVIVDPAAAAGNPLSFRSYVQGSGAEFSVAQSLFARTRSGWFSDRSTRYLASGRPALVQDTCFSRRLPVGEGLVAFRTPGEAVAGAWRIAEDYDRHARAARALAEEYFDSARVLTDMLERAGVSPR